jgi:hypothetical protein
MFTRSDKAFCFAAVSGELVPPASQIGRCRCWRDKRTRQARTARRSRFSIAEVSVTI